MIELVVDNGTGGVCRGPTLAGWPLRMFEWVLATPLGVPVLRAMLRDSGMPQVLAHALPAAAWLGLAAALCSWPDLLCVWNQALASDATSAHSKGVQIHHAQVQYHASFHLLLMCRLSPT